MNNNNSKYVQSSLQLFKTAVFLFIMYVTEHLTAVGKIDGGLLSCVFYFYMSQVIYPQY